MLVKRMKKSCRCTCVQRGLSLVELLLVTVIAGIVLGLGAPALGSLIEATRLHVTVNDFFSAVTLARSEALQRGARVDLVPAGDGRSWSNGWIVLIDANGNHRHDSGETVIQQFAAPPRGVAIRQDFATPELYLAFNAHGRSRGTLSSQQPNAGSWLFQAGERQRKLIVSFTSRPRICDPVTAPTRC